MIAFEWTFSGCKVIQNLNDLENVIKVVEWTLTANDGKYSVNATGVTELPDPVDTEFIPFTELTKETVISWVISGISKEDLDSLKDHLQKQLIEMNKPVLVQMSLPFM